MIERTCAFCGSGPGCGPGHRGCVIEYESAQGDAFWAHRLCIVEALEQAA